MKPCSQTHSLSVVEAGFKPRAGGRASWCGEGAVAGRGGGGVPGKGAALLASGSALVWLPSSTPWHCPQLLRKVLP